MNVSLRSAPWWLRALFVFLGLVSWFSTQAAIGNKKYPEGVISDGLLDLLEPSNLYLNEHAQAANLLLICSSAVIDVLGVFLLSISIFGRTLRPFLGLLLVFALRQICQMLCGLPPPPGMIWRYPGFPSLLVTYGVATDFFFSGHTALAVLGAVEVVRYGGRRWLILGLLITLFESLTILMLRAHYTMDVFTGAIAALYASVLSARWAPACDSFLATLLGGPIEYRREMPTSAEVVPHAAEIDPDNTIVMEKLPGKPSDPGD